MKTIEQLREAKKAALDASDAARAAGASTPEIIALNKVYSAASDELAAFVRANPQPKTAYQIKCEAEAAEDNRRQLSAAQSLASKAHTGTVSTPESRRAVREAGADDLDQ